MESITSLKIITLIAIFLIWNVIVGAPLVLIGVYTFAFGFNVVVVLMGLGALVVRSNERLIELLYRQVDRLKIARIRRGLLWLSISFFCLAAVPLALTTLGVS